MCFIIDKTTKKSRHSRRTQNSRYRVAGKTGYMIREIYRALRLRGRPRRKVSPGKLGVVPRVKRGQNNGHLVVLLATWLSTKYCRYSGCSINRGTWMDLGRSCWIYACRNICVLSVESENCVFLTRYASFIVGN